MNVTKYKLKKDVIILDNLCLSGYILYIEYYDPVNGKPQRVFDENKNILGKINSDFYWKFDKIMVKI